MLLLVAALSASVALSAQAPDRGRPPAPGPAPALKLPAIQKRQLANGLPVWIVELHEVPVAQVNLVVFSGSAEDPPGKFGVTSLMTAMLEEGAGSRSALEIADAVDFLGADLGAGSTFDASAVRLHVPVARLADALPIMADVALRPTFPQEELERVRQQRLTALLQARDDPATIAAQAFARILYGKTHRYGTAMAGTAETITAFTTADLRAQYTAALPAGQQRPARGRRHRARQGDGAPRDRLWRLAVPGQCDARQTAGRPAAGEAGDLHRRQAGRAADADPHRIDWRAAIDRRLLSPSGHEHGPRRVVLVAVEHEPAREERLHLRRLVRIRHARRGRALRRRGGRPDRQDVRGAARNSSTS